MNLKTKKGAPLVSADRPTLLKARKIFLVEPAFFHDLLPLLEELKKDNFDQVYFIGTPHLVSNDLASSGFLFDAICARARMGRLKDIFYSEHSFMDNSYIPSDFGKNLKEQLPTNVFNEEMEAQYLENI